MNILNPARRRPVWVGKIFECRNCGCEFQLDKMDVEELMRIPVLRCPECKIIVNLCDGCVEPPRRGLRLVNSNGDVA